MNYQAASFLVFFTIHSHVCSEMHGRPWNPMGCSKETFMRYNGCSEDAWKLNRILCTDIQNILTRKALLAQGMSETEVDELLRTSQTEELEELFEEHASNVTLSHNWCIMDDTMIDNEQAAQFRDELQGRVKRKALGHTLYNRWPTTVHYKLDGSLMSSSMAALLYSAITLWEEDTCLEFVEHDADEQLEEQHIVFIVVWSLRCFSFIGRTSYTEQPIYLNNLCFELGVLAHEIAHALGVVHEHQRPDRDSYINVNSANINRGSESNFIKFDPKLVNVFELPYDYGSVSHYGSQYFSKNNQNSIDTRDQRFQNSIGQREELTFWDKRVVNLMYCNDTCPRGEMDSLCQNNGYPHPKNCSRCLCPDGLGGTYCTQAAPSVGAQCGGQLLAVPQVKIASSPGYTGQVDSYTAYNGGQECSWLIIAPAGEHVVLQFEGVFGLTQSYSGSCKHWVELHYDEDLSLPGNRFCGTTTPTETITSRNNRMVVSFKAKNSGGKKRDRLGFSFSYFADGDECASNPCQNGGICTDLVGSHRCVCDSMYTGSACENGLPSMIHSDRIDLMFVLDNSNFEDKDLFSMKMFGKNVMDTFKYGRDNTRMALMTFADYAQPIAMFNTYRSYDSFLGAFLDVETSSGTCNYYYPLWLLYSDIYHSKNGDRSNAPDVIVFFIDNNPSQEVVEKLWSSLSRLARYLHQSGKEILVIAVGHRVADFSLLSDITVRPENVIHVNSYNELFNPDILENTTNLIHERAVWLRLQDPDLYSFSTTSSAPTTSTTTPTTTTTSTTSPTTTTTRPTTTTTTPTTTTTTPTTTTMPTTTTTTPTTSANPATTTTSPTTTPTVVTTTTTTTKTTTTTPTTTTAQRASSLQPPQSTKTPSGNGHGSLVTGPHPPGFASVSPTGPPSTPPPRPSTVVQNLWYTYSQCSAECGGCGQRIIKLFTRLSDGRIWNINRRYEPCNLHPCTQRKTYVGKPYNKETDPYCCYGYELASDNTKCIRSS